MNPGRRQAIQNLAALTTALYQLPTVNAMGIESTAMYAYVGCRTTKERNARGKGINVYRVDGKTGDWKHVQLVEGTDNPSFLTLDRTQKSLYAVHGDLSQITAYSVDRATGKLTLLNQQSTEGKNPAHLVVDPTNRFVIVGNYATGSVVSLPIQEDGSLGRVSDLAQLPGKPGPHRTQQASSHPHDVPFDRSGRFFIVPDKGLDRVFAFRLDAVNGKITPANPPFVQAREGAGPRHVTFHPAKPLAYVMNELDSTITTYRYDAETAALTPVQIVPTIPETFTGDNTGAEIEMARSGKFLFGSNRGHDSIVTMRVDPDSGLLKPVGWAPTQGKGPRFFTLDPVGKMLYAANENSDSVVGFRIDEASGQLTPSGLVLQTGSPVCLVFAHAQ